MQASAAGGRYYGLDWLRIGAFALLILYHAGMFFVPWDWHVKTAEPLEWLELPMLALNPWRLPLLFVVSGVAARFLLAKLGGPGPFTSARSIRLLVPLFAAMALFVAPQAWAELQAKAQYPHGFLHYWLNDYFIFGTRSGVITPTWMQLWFVAYLWVYCMAFAGLACLPERARARLQAGFDALFGSRWVLAVAVAFYFAARTTLYPLFEENHTLIADPYAHVVYGFAFFFGVGLARSRPLWARIVEQWKMAAVLAVAAFACIVALDLAIAGESGPVERIVRSFLRSVHAWGAIVALLGVARLHLDFDHPARRYLTEAIFPFYIAHQTIIVLVGHWLAPQRLGPGLELAIIGFATVAGCAAAYELGRRIKWLRPLIGLKMMSDPRPERPIAPRSASGRSPSR